MADFALSVGDTEPPLVATLAIPPNCPTLVGASATLVRWPEQQATVKTSYPMTIVDSTNWVVRRDWSVGDNVIAGNFRWKVVITFANGNQLSCPNDGTSKSMVIST